VVLTVPLIVLPAIDFPQRYGRVIVPAHVIPLPRSGAAPNRDQPIANGPLSHHKNR
jgi:hypothetical protein